MLETFTWSQKCSESTHQKIADKHSNNSMWQGESAWESGGGMFKDQSCASGMVGQEFIRRAPLIHNCCICRRRTCIHLVAVKKWLLLATQSWCSWYKLSLTCFLTSNIQTYLLQKTMSAYCGCKEVVASLTESIWCSLTCLWNVLP